MPQPYPFGLPEELPRSHPTPILAKSLVVFTGQGRLIGGTVTNTNAATQFLQFYDSNAVPASGAVPLISKSLPGSDATGFYFGSAGRWFTGGCVLAISSTIATFTAAAANDCLIDVQFVPQVI